ncbi:hypothetical protein M413DRAFT_9880 [Hebeloma cylindrosporum]|uniref:Uncharacterized protein n=1 Tax=Hebeloma cylindrosporum TaxID=76867 RepID=A0A0C3C2H3_HEBCY|nr:hypothetical protein M413DRAFT_9880 [Hebeloma cylindrosporum h7]
MQGERLREKDPTARPQRWTFVAAVLSVMGIKCLGIPGYGFDSDLHRCALVSRSFRPRSEFHIFEFLHFKEKNNARQRRLQTLAELIQGNPKIADYIRGLSLQRVGLDYSWIGKNPIFLDIMRAVSRPERPLRKLTFQADYSFHRPFHRFDNKTEFQPLFDDFFRPFIFPFITTLVLQCMEGVPLEVVEGCVLLIDLELHYVTLVGKSSKTTLDSPRPALKRLWSHSSRPPLWDTCPMDGWDTAFDLSQLQYLVVFTDKLLDLKFEQHIVDVAGASLQELSLRAGTFALEASTVKNRKPYSMQTGKHCASNSSESGQQMLLQLPSGWIIRSDVLIQIWSYPSFGLTFIIDASQLYQDSLKEKIASLVNSPGCTNDLSHGIEAAEYYARHSRRYHTLWNSRGHCFRLKEGGVILTLPGDGRAAFRIIGREIFVIEPTRVDVPSFNFIVAAKVCSLDRPIAKVDRHTHSWGNPQCLPNLRKPKSPSPKQQRQPPKPISSGKSLHDGRRLEGKAHSSPKSMGTPPLAAAKVQIKGGKGRRTALALFPS